MASRFLVFFLFGVVLARPFFPHFSPVDSKAVQRSALCRSRRELSNEYLLAKIGVDTAENEPCKVCPLSAYRSPRYGCRTSYRVFNNQYWEGGARNRYVIPVNQWKDRFKSPSGEMQADDGYVMLYNNKV